MRRFPILLGGGLLALWLLLNGTLAPAQIALGAVLAVSLTLVFRAVRPLQPRMRRFRTASLLFARVLLDILRSNLAVARIILGLVRDHEVRSGFLDVPLDLRDPHGLAVLAAIVTSTPGTIWADLARDGKTLTLHVLDLQNEAAWIRTIKQRYERALMEIFE
jgi:multicomponent K+:H+ antiporter subunit E